MKNLKTLICNVATILFGILTLIFTSQLYSSAKAMGMVVSKANGYDLIDFSVNIAKYNLRAVSVLFVCIFMGLAVVSAILNLLVHFNVIKCEKIANILNIVNVVLSVLAVVFSICVIAAMSSISKDLPSYIEASLGWACILNLVLSILTLCANACNLVLNFFKK